VGWLGEVVEEGEYVSSEYQATMKALIKKAEADANADEQETTTEFTRTTIAMTCPVCVENLPLDSEMWMRLSCCGKGLHHKCLSQLVNTKHMTEKKKRTCPFCRAQIAKTTKEMIRALRRHVSEGRSWAQSNVTLGQFFGNGHGVKLSHKKAKKLYEKAIAQDDDDATNAMYKLGIMYENGYGVTQSFPKALELYERAALLGLGTAQFNAGNMYKNYNGVKDYAKGIKFMSMAANQGMVNAQMNLGNSYADGVGVAQSRELARYWWTKSAAQGCERSKEYLKE